MTPGRGRQEIGSASAGPPRLSRALLLPGPLAPHTHFGVTLLRHVVLTGLRSALHRLGLPLIRGAPVRIVDLRLYLDATALEEALGEAPGAAEAVAALVDPGGVAVPSPAGARLAGAASLHRLRLAFQPCPSRPAVARGGGEPPWRRFRDGLSALLPPLNDALLAELLASLARRRARAGGRSPSPCLGREAWLLRAGRPARLDCLGPPEPMLPSWASRPELAETARAAEAGRPLPARHRLRGRFRELYRAVLDVLTPAYRRLAEEAARRGVLDDPADAFFLPLDVAEDLTAEGRPAWLAAAVAANRREYLALQGRPAPADRLAAGAPAAAAPGSWELAALHPFD